MTNNIPARPTTYKGIQMRSRLEADYAARLDRQGVTWEYEPVCFASDEGQWLPDFRIGTGRILEELKPAYLLEWKEDETDFFSVVNRIDIILKQMTIAWQSEPDARLKLVFWTYGATEPTLVIESSSATSWMAFTGDLGGDSAGVPLLWAGMGQYALLGLAPTGGPAVKERLQALAGTEPDKHAASVSSAGPVVTLTVQGYEGERVEVYLGADEAAAIGNALRRHGGNAALAEPFSFAPDPVNRQVEALLGSPTILQEA